MRYVLPLMLLATPAFAQSTPEYTAMGQKLIHEINAGIVCSASVIVARTTIEKLEVRLQQLEKQLREKGDDDKK